MKRYIIPGLAAAAFVTGAVAFAQTGGGPGHRGGHMMFDMLDANKDGTITRAEATAAAEKKFAEVDTDKDGVISAAERDAVRARMHDMMFQRMDSDKSGQISPEEFRAAHEKMRGHHGRMGGGAMLKADTSKADVVARAQAMFDRVDADKDGTITTAERDAARSKMNEMRQKHGHERPKG